MAVLFLFLGSFRKFCRLLTQKKKSDTGFSRVL